MRCEVAPKDVAWLHDRPVGRRIRSGPAKIIAPGRECGSVDGSGGGASHDGKRIAVFLNALQLSDALQDAGLIGAASAASCHHEPQTPCRTPAHFIGNSDARRRGSFHVQARARLRPAYLAGRQRIHRKSVTLQTNFIRSRGSGVLQGRPDLRGAPHPSGWEHKSDERKH
jgi:hypothetical protein